MKVSSNRVVPNLAGRSPPATERKQSFMSKRSPPRNMLADSCDRSKPTHQGVSGVDCDNVACELNATTVHGYLLSAASRGVESKAKTGAKGRVKHYGL